MPPFGTGLTLAVSVTGWPIHATGIAPEGVPVVVDTGKGHGRLGGGEDKGHVLDGVGGDPVCGRDRHRVGAYGARGRRPVDRSVPERVGRKGKPRWQGARRHGQGRRGRARTGDFDGPAVVVRVREPALDQLNGGGAPPVYHWGSRRCSRSGQDAKSQYGRDSGKPRGRGSEHSFEAGQPRYSPLSIDEIELVSSPCLGP